MRKNQRGYSVIEAILVLIIVGLVVFITWYVFHTKSSTDDTLSSAGNTQITPKQQSNNSAAQTKTATKIIQTKTDAKLGDYLADSVGKALYTYGADTTGVSNCTGSCLAVWPTYKATSTTSLPANVTIITRGDGGTQYAYKGMPLYYYTGDNSEGVVTGDGINNFHVAKP